jgi:hypothetical protein
MSDEKKSSSSVGEHPILEHPKSTELKETKSMKANSTRVFFTFFVLSFFFLNAAVGFATDLHTKLAQGMELLKAETARLGLPKCQGPSLYFGDKMMNDTFDIVDKVKGQFGVTATLFVKDDGCFRRISTNIIRVAGIRAVGSILDPNGPAIGALSKGERYEGPVDILGTPYQAIYEPIRDYSGVVIGAYYVGVKVE